jgi:hypothetical protein
MFVGTLLLAVSVQGQTEIDFVVSGDTFGTNSGFDIVYSQGNSLIGSCTYDLSTIPGGAVFDTDDADTAATDFGTADTATTGLTSPESDALNDADVPEDATSFTMSFSDFDPGETFTFGIDVDFTPTGDEQVLAPDLEGATMSCMVGGAEFSCVLEGDVPNNMATCQLLLGGGQAPAIPTLSQWGLVLLTLMLGAGAVWRLRR